MTSQNHNIFLTLCEIHPIDATEDLKLRPRMMPTRLNHYNLSTGYFRLYFDITTKSLSYVLAAALPDIELSWWCIKSAHKRTILSILLGHYSLHPNKKTYSPCYSLPQRASSPPYSLSLSASPPHAPPQPKQTRLSMRSLMTFPSRWKLRLRSIQTSC